MLDNRCKLERYLIQNIQLLIINYIKKYITFSNLGAILIIDQILLPMSHIGSIPFKLSYLILFLFFLLYLTNNKNIFNNYEHNIFKSFTKYILFIIFLGLFGDFTLSIYSSNINYQESIKSYTLYLMVIMSFGMGIKSLKFNFKLLPKILLCSVGLNFLFIFFNINLPSFLINYYYPPMQVDKFALDGITSVTDILEMGRPRGLFSNPNASAFMINIISLIIFVSLKHKYLKLKSNFLNFLLLLSPLFIITVLASRGEMLIGILLFILNYRIVYKNKNKQSLLLYFFFLIIFILFSFYFIAAKYNLGDTMQESLNRLVSIFDILSKNRTEDSEVSAEGILRPFFTINKMITRFVMSPLWGSGFATSTNTSFDYGTQYFHNDWFRLLITSGILGVITMFNIIRKFCTSIDVVLIIPFILPGLINTFQLNIPAMIFYFFFVGLFWKLKTPQSS